MSRIYISGGITNVPDYMEKFKAAEEKLTAQGYDVVNPTKCNVFLPEMTYEEHMEIDMKLLTMCSSIYMLEGWEKSNGACKEYYRAAALGLRIIEETPLGK